MWDSMSAWSINLAQPNSPWTSPRVETHNQIVAAELALLLEEHSCVDEPFMLPSPSDGSLQFFREDDAELAFLFAVRLVTRLRASKAEPKIASSVAICNGYIDASTTSNSWPIGRPIDLASRLARVAGPNQILLSKESHGLWGAGQYDLQKFDPSLPDVSVDPDKAAADFIDVRLPGSVEPAHQPVLSIAQLVVDGKHIPIRNHRAMAAQLMEIYPFIVDAVADWRDRFGELIPKKLAGVRRNRLERVAWNELAGEFDDQTSGESTLVQLKKAIESSEELRRLPGLAGYFIDFNEAFGNLRQLALNWKDALTSDEERERVVACNEILKAEDSPMQILPTVLYNLQNAVRTGFRAQHTLDREPATE
jgi:hypothetical protein